MPTFANNESKCVRPGIRIVERDSPTEAAVWVSHYVNCLKIIKPRFWFVSVLAPSVHTVANMGYPPFIVISSSVMCHGIHQINLL